MKKSVFLAAIFMAGLMLLHIPGHAGAYETRGAIAMPIWSKLIDRLAADGYSRDEMIALFARPEVVYLPKTIRSKMVPPFERKFHPPASSGKSPTALLYAAMVTPQRISEARKFLNANIAVFEQVEQVYHIPKSVLAAIIAVETRQGTFLGEQPAFSALASLALATDMSVVLPFFSNRKLTKEQRAWIEKRAVEKGNWAYAELKALLAYGQASGRDAVTMPGSIYGAIGLCQFMPTSAMRLAVDGNGDGRIDLFELEDAIHSIGNFLKANRWNSSQSPENNRKALMAYNPSKIYVNTVLFIAAAIKNE